MFDFFKKNKKDKNDLAIEAVVNMLFQQIQFGYHVDNVEFDNRLSNYYCRGYLFGFCDAFLQVINLRDDDNLSMKLLSTVHTKIYGEVKSTSIIAQSLKDQNNSSFEKGRNRGGQDCHESIKYNVPSIALSNYLLKGTET